MKHFTRFSISILILLHLMGCKNNDRLEPISQNTSIESVNPVGTNPTDPKNVQTAKVFQFVPNGDFSGRVDREPFSNMYPPGLESFATLKRGHDFLQVNIQSNVLPQGAYVVYWLIFNDPGKCMDSHHLGNNCAGFDDGDLSLPTASISWATGKVIKVDGPGSFQARIYKGEPRPDNIHLGGELKAPLENPKEAEVHLLIKHQGVASANPDTLFAQTHGLFGKSYLQLKAVFPAMGE